MPRGKKSAYTDKQKRQAEYTEQSEIDQSCTRGDAKRIAWATVNKQDGGGRKSGSGRNKKISQPEKLGEEKRLTPPQFQV
ncbi:MAG: hypothetical protein ABI538_02650 [Pseudoxanthomonas sp.]